MSAPRPDSELLVAHALGLLGAAEHAAVEAALAADTSLAAEHAEIARHLALYQHFPAPPEAPPFTRIAAECHVAPVVRPAYWIRWSAAAAALLLVGAGAALLMPQREPDPIDQPLAVFSPGFRYEGRTLEAGSLVTAESVLELRIASRVRAVLDGGAALRLVSAEAVRLEAGRAYFEVPPGPFTVETAHGAVRVLGTMFEVDVRAGLAVNVAEGRVRAGGREVGAGERLAEGKVGPVPEIAGAFFRRPVLRLEAPRSAEPGAAIHVSLVFANPGRERLELRGPETVATGALLSFTGPGGVIETRGLDFAQALSGGLDALRPVVLGPHERRVVVFRVQLPEGPPGSWRLSALYRPQGEAALASEPLSLEVR